MFVNQLRTIHFDTLVIGGGITGAGIALDAVTRGLKVALVDMQDFSAGTSSRSTKLIHGGLRYLKQFEWKLVREVGKERAIVYQNGPHVTRPEKMLLPIYQDGALGKIPTSLGLKLYDYLAGVNKQERRKMLTAQKTLQKEPLLRVQGLKGSGLYTEYRTDDARLTIEVIKKAVEQGAIALNYVKVQSFLFRHGRIVGAKVVDQITGHCFEIQAQIAVNATGSWVDEVRRFDFSLSTKSALRLTKGVHIVVDRNILPIKHALYFDTPDKRMVFAIPRENKTYIGTTDTFCDCPELSPSITVNDCLYLLKATAHIFPNISLTLNDIETAWAGIRPLIFEANKGASEISRKDEIWHSDSGLLSIAGGKLTGYRKMANTVVDSMVKSIETNRKNRIKPCQTIQMPISGGEGLTPESFGDFVKDKTREGVALGLSHDAAKDLTSCYGANIDKIYARIEKCQQKSSAYQLPIELIGRLDYAILEEMTLTPVDFFFRRTGQLLFKIDEVKKWKIAVLTYMADVFSWNEQELKKYESELNEAILLATKPIDEL